MIVEPREKQHESIQKLSLNVNKLREATDEALSLFFSGKDNEKNSLKKPYLDEIFKIARLEERYKNGEIGMVTVSLDCTTFPRLPGSVTFSLCLTTLVVSGSIILLGMMPSLLSRLLADRRMT